MYAYGEWRWLQNSWQIWENQLWECFQDPGKWHTVLGGAFNLIVHFWSLQCTSIDMNLSEQLEHLVQKEESERTWTRAYIDIIVFRGFSFFQNHCTWATQITLINKICSQENHCNHCKCHQIWHCQAHFSGPRISKLDMGKLQANWQWQSWSELQYWHSLEHVAL